MEEQIGKIAEVREAIERYATMLRDCDEEGDYVSLSDIARDLDKFATKLNALHIRIADEYEKLPKLE